MIMVLKGEKQHFEAGGSGGEELINWISWVYQDKDIINTFYVDKNLK